MPFAGPPQRRRRRREAGGGQGGGTEPPGAFQASRPCQALWAAEIWQLPGSPCPFSIPGEARPGQGANWGEESTGDARRTSPAPRLHSGQNFVGRGEPRGASTRGYDSRAVLAPPRPVISPPLPARVNNSPGCQMQVTCGSSEGAGEAKAHFWGAGGGVGNQLKLNKGSGGENGGNKLGNFF